MKKILYTLFVMACIANTNAQVPSYVPTNGLVAYYPFNGNANDESGNGNNLINNNVTFDNDRFENQLSSAYFSGNGSELFLENSINQLLTEDPNQTFSFWFKSVTPTNRYIFEYGSQYSHRFRFVTFPNGEIGISGENEGCSSNRTINEAPELNNGWHHFVISINSSNYTVYYDGEVLFSKAHSGFNCVDPINKLNIGNDINGGLKEHTNMIMDDIGIWNRALTQQEVTNLYASNSSNECSTLVINTGVLNTSPVTYTSTVNIYPNPANDQITIDCGNLDNVEGWNIKITNTLGQEVFNKPMDTQQYVIPLNTWTGQGMYFVKIINAQNEVVNIKKIVLQ